MRYLLILFLLTSTFSAEINPSLNISGNPGIYNINTADYYSWQTRTKVFKFENTKVTEISHILKECLSVYGKIQINEKLNMVVITEEKEKLSNLLELCKKLDVAEMAEFVKLSTETIKLNFTVPTKIMHYLESYLSIDGNIQAYNDLNYVVVHDHKNAIERINKEIKKFDIAPKEIQISFNVVEIINDDFSDNGINWDELFNVIDTRISIRATKSKYDKKVTPTSTYSTNEKTDQLNISGDASFSLRNFNKFLRFMIEDGSAQLISENSIATINNHLSVFYYNYEGYKTKVSIIPNLINDDMIKMNIQISVNNDTLYNSTVYGEIGKPKKLVRFEEMSKNKNRKRVPGLGTILPFIFSRKSRSKTNKKLDIVFTPVLVK